MLPIPSVLLLLFGCIEVQLREIGTPAPADPPPPPPADTGVGSPTDTGPQSETQGAYDLPEAQPMTACSSAPARFELELAWEWTGWSEDARVRNVRTTPQLADLDGNGVLEVVFVAVNDVDAPSKHVLFVLDGRSGDQILAVPDVYGYASRFAVLDADGDGSDEIVVTSAGDVIALDLQGTRWIHEPSRDCASYVLPGDFDDDGVMELATACGMLDAATGLLLSMEPRCARTAFDVDGDGTEELFCADAVYGSDGTEVVALQQPSLGTLPDPSGGFLVKTNEGIDRYDERFTWIGTTPTLLEPSTVGACSADADADGVPEVFLPLQDDLAAWSIDGPHRWSAHRPGVHGGDGTRVCTAVDLDADGCAEIVWPQNGAPRIHDASTGELVGDLELGEANTTRLQPLPIEDIDGDGSLDILINGSALGSPQDHWTGVRMVREAHGAWVGEAPPLLRTGAR